MRVAARCLVTLALCRRRHNEQPTLPPYCVVDICHRRSEKTEELPILRAKNRRSCRACLPTVATTYPAIARFTTQRYATAAVLMTIYSGALTLPFQRLVAQA